MKRLEIVSIASITKKKCFLDGDISFKDQKIENDDIVVFTDQTDEELIIGVIEASSKVKTEREEKGTEDGK